MMSFSLKTSRCSRAFFSIDASFAFITAVSLFAMLLSVLFCAAITAKSQSSDIASENLALRFSSFALDSISVSGGNPSLDGYVSVNEIDGAKFISFNGNGAMQRVGASYASLRLTGKGGQAGFQEFGAKNNSALYCAKRLAVMGGEIVRLDACIS